MVYTKRKSDEKKDLMDLIYHTNRFQCWFGVVCFVCGIVLLPIGYLVNREFLVGGYTCLALSLFTLFMLLLVFLSYRKIVRAYYQSFPQEEITFEVVEEDDEIVISRFIDDKKFSFSRDEIIKKYRGGKNTVIILKGNQMLFLPKSQEVISLLFQK